jgi:hypothetical protein
MDHRRNAFRLPLRPFQAVIHRAAACRKRQLPAAASDEPISFVMVDV